MCKFRFMTDVRTCKTSVIAVTGTSLQYIASDMKGGLVIE